MKQAGLLPLRPPYAPGASEKVSVGPLSCPWMYSGSSTPTEHVPLWGVLTVRPNPTPYREKRSSALGRVCSFPSWPEGPTGWGDWAPNPCVRITVPETEREWASHRDSWGCGRPVLSWEQGLPPRLSWRRSETGPARRVGPCTDMFNPRTQSAETACVEEESRHESTRPSGWSLQTNLGDGCTRKCVSAWASWTVACEGSDSKLGKKLGGCCCGAGAGAVAGGRPRRRAGWGAAGGRVDATADCLRLLLYSRELLGEVLDRVAKEAGLGHGGIKEPDFVGIPHVGQTQPEMAFLDHQSGHRTAHYPRRNLHRPKREVHRSTKFVMNLWVMTTLVQVSQCLGLMDLQQRHSV